LCRSSCCHEAGGTAADNYHLFFTHIGLISSLLFMP
jgi:hypothetical protein